MLQRRSGPCDDATNPVAHPLQRRIACCNSTRQVRATTQPQQLPLRCNSASRVATALSRFVRRRNQLGGPYVAAAHRVLQRRSVRHRRTAARERSLLQQCTACCNSVGFCCKQVDAPLVAARCSGAACCNACCNAVQPAVAQPNLLRKAHGNSDAAQYVAAQCRVATDRSPLQQTAAPVQPAAVSSTQRRQHAHGTGRACYTAA